MASANYSHTERCALIVTEDNVRHLAKAMSDYAGRKTDISFEFKDGFSISSDDIDEVMNVGRLRSTLVERISLSSRSELKAEKRRSIDVSISEGVGSGSLRLSVRSDFDDMAGVTAEVIREAHDMRPGYNFLHSGSPPIIYWVGMVLAPAYGVWAVMKDVVVDPKTVDPDLGNLVSFGIYVMMYGVLGLFIAHILRGVAGVWMPPFLVAIGKGETIATAKADTRKWALRLFLGAALIAVVTALGRSVLPS